jgi:hypothetical protein
MPNTLLLDNINWDLLVDLNGNIAMAQEPYSLAQDVASQARLFAGELWFDTVQGIPYLPGETFANISAPPGVASNVLGQYPSLALWQQYYKEAAFLVQNVSSAQMFFAALASDRSLGGQLVITASDGPTLAVSLAGDLFGNPQIGAVSNVNLTNLSGSGQ